jgi:hypothetical protein
MSLSVKKGDPYRKSFAHLLLKVLLGTQMTVVEV